MCGRGHFVRLSAGQADSIGADEGVGRESPTFSGITWWPSRDGLILWSGFSSEGTYIGDSDQNQPLISCLGHSIASLAKYLETLGFVSKPESLVEFGLSPGEKKTTLNARAPSTGRLYALR